MFDLSLCGVALIIAVAMVGCSADHVQQESDNRVSSRTDGGLVFGDGSPWPPGLGDECDQDRPCGDDERCCHGFCSDAPCVITLAGSGQREPNDVPRSHALLGGIQGLVADGAGGVLFAQRPSSGIYAVNAGTELIGPVRSEHVGLVIGGRYGCREGSTSDAETGAPLGMTRDDKGQTYIADIACGVIWKLSSDYKTLSLFAGRPLDFVHREGKGREAGFVGPRGITFGKGKLYISDFGAHVILQADLDGTVRRIAGIPGQAGEVDGKALEAKFNQPSGIAVAPDDTVFVGDWTNGTVRRITGLGGKDPQVTTVVPLNAPIDPKKCGSDLRKHGYGAFATMHATAGPKVYLSYWASGIFTIAPPAAGNTVWQVTPLVAEGDPIAVADSRRSIVTALEPSGKHLWTGGWINSSPPGWDNTIHRIDVAAKQSLLAVGRPGISGVRDGRLNEASLATARCGGDVTIDDDGVVWVAEPCTNRVRRIDPQGAVRSYGTGRHGIQGGTPEQAQFCVPAAIVASGGEILVANSECESQLMAINRVTGAVSVLAAAEQVSTASPNGSLCVPGEPGCARLRGWGGMAVDSNDNVYVGVNQGVGAATSEQYGNSCYDGMQMIVKIPQRGRGAPSFIAGSRNSPGDDCADGPLGKGQFGQWIGDVAIDDADNTLYVADQGCGLRKVAPDGTISTITNEIKPSSVALAPAALGKGKLVVGTDHALLLVEIASGKHSLLAGLAGDFDIERHYQDGPADRARFWGPYALATGPAGKVYILDFNNSRLRVLQP